VLVFAAVYAERDKCAVQCYERVLGGHIALIKHHHTVGSILFFLVSLALWRDVAWCGAFSLIVSKKT
jgi:hypothetical protein